MVEEGVRVNHVGVDRSVVPRRAGLEENAQVLVGPLRGVADGQTERRERCVAHTGAVIVVVASVGQLLYVRCPKGISPGPCKRLAHLLLGVFHQRVAGLRVPGDLLPADQVQAPRRGHVAAENVIKPVVVFND